jgi:hypothetical protein
MRWKFLACGPSVSLDHLLSIESTQHFYNNTDFGSDKGTSILPALLAIYPELFFDSYLADGRIGTDDVGVLRSVDADGYIPITEGSTPPAPGITIPALIPVLNDNATLGYTGPDGWLVPGGVAGPDTATNVIFIAQFTSDGNLSFTFNISTLGVDRFIPETGDISPRYNTDNITYSQASAPTVNITSPENDDQYGNETITIEATATDSDGTITQVEFFVDGSSIGTDDSDPYEMDWAVTNGDHVITAVATDNDGLTGTSSSVTIHGPVIDAIEDPDIRSINVFPNPSVDGLFYLDMGTINFASGAYYTVYDLIGNELNSYKISDAELKSNAVVVDLSSYAQGTYLLNLIIGNEVYTRSLIKY